MGYGSAYRPRSNVTFLMSFIANHWNNETSEPERRGIPCHLVVGEAEHILTSDIRSPVLDGSFHRAARETIVPHHEAGRRSPSKTAMRKNEGGTIKLAVWDRYDPFSKRFRNIAHIVERSTAKKPWWAAWKAVREPVVRATLAARTPR